MQPTDCFKVAAAPGIDGFALWTAKVMVRMRDRYVKWKINLIVFNNLWLRF